MKKMTELENGIANGAGEIFKVPRRGFTAWNRDKTALPDIVTSKGMLYQCVRCGHKWKTKIDRVPMRCPGCQTIRYQSPLPPEKCSLFQGLLAEHIVKCMFNNAKRMPIQNGGFDYLIEEKRIDVKSSSLRYEKSGTRWQVNINHNEKADEFLVVALNNRTDLRPMHIWLIPGKLVNHLKGLSITNSAKALHRWAIYEIVGKKFDVVCDECEVLRSRGWTGDWAFEYGDRHIVKY